jgi:hypothetical protein
VRSAIFEIDAWLVDEEKMSDLISRSHDCFEVGIAVACCLVDVDSHDSCHIKIFASPHFQRALAKWSQFEEAAQICLCYNK